MLMDFIAERIPLGMCVELDNDSTPKAMEVMQKKFPSFVIKEQKPYEYVISEEEDSEDDSEEEESQAGESEEDDGASWRKAGEIDDIS